MTPRIPLAVAVAGALLVGGAATGTTHATWRAGATVEGRAVDSGRMGFTVADAAPLAPLPPGGDPATTTVAVADTSAGRNLTQRVTATVTGQPAGTTATVGTSCGETGPTAAVDLHPGQAATLCLRVVASAAPSPGTVTVSLAGAQLPGGWTTPSRTLELPVQLQATPTTPAVRCGTQVGSTGHSFEWDAVPGATEYRIYVAEAADGPWPSSPLAVGPGLSHTGVVSDQGNKADRYFRVTAVVGGVESAASSVVHVRRNGVSQNFNCEVLA